MAKIKAIISGSDGTLVDSLYMIRRGQYEAAVEYMVERGRARHGLPAYEEYEQFINRAVGGRSRDTIQRTLETLFAKPHDKKLEDVDFDAIERRLRLVQDRLAPLYICPFYDLSGFLHWVGQSNLYLGIFTSGTRYQIIRNWGNALPVLGFVSLYSQVGIAEEEKITAIEGRTKATFGLEKFTIVTSDDVKATKPNPEGLLRTLKELDVKPEEAVMVGDLGADIEAGKKAGVMSIGISHGFGTAEELKDAGAAHVVGSLKELIAFVEAHNSKA